MGVADGGMGVMVGVSVGMGVSVGGMGVMVRVTVGVGTNVIEASWEALYDCYHWGLSDAGSRVASLAG